MEPQPTLLPQDTGSTNQNNNETPNPVVSGSVITPENNFQPDLQPNNVPALQPLVSTQFAKPPGKSKRWILILALLILIGLVAGGVLFYTKNKKPDNKLGSAQTTQPKVDPYAGWKNYCEPLAKFCIKYPTDWKITSENDPSFGSASIIVNQASTVNLNFGDLIASATGSPTEDTSDPFSQSPVSPDISVDVTKPVSFFVTSISDTSSKSSGFKVVGGYTAGAGDNIPTYFIVDDTQVTSLSLKAGQASLVQLPFSVADSHQSGNKIIVGVGPISASPYSAAQAAAWFTNTDAKTSLQILQSFSAQ